MNNPQRAKQKPSTDKFPSAPSSASKPSAVNDSLSSTMSGLERWSRENPLLALASALVFGYVSSATGLDKAPLKATGLLIGGAADLTGGTIRGAATLTGETVKGAGSLAVGTLGALLPLAGGAAGAVGHVGLGATSAVGHVGGGAVRATGKVLNAVIIMAPLLALAYLLDSSGMIRPKT